MHLSTFICHGVVLLLALTAAFSATAQTKKDSVTAVRDTAYTNLKEATVTATRLVFVTKKDTVVYDMDALQTSQGDMLGDVIAKMPGLELRDGALYFKGRAVNRLLVNGIDFVRGDTKLALSNLPAYSIKSVKAYEGKTDQHKVTGIDDGVKEQVVDVILRREYMGTWTGNADLGGGTDDRWMLRGFANTFTDRFRATIYGGAANLGAYQSVTTDGNWSENESGGSSGDTKYILPGGTFMWMNKRPQDKAGYFKVEASTSWDYRGHNDAYYSEAATRLDDGTNKYDVTERATKNDEKIWNARLYFTWKPTDRTHVEFGPNYSYRTYDSRNHSRAGNWNVPVADRYLSPLDSLAAGPDGWPDGGANYLQRGESAGLNKRHNYNHWLWATHKLTDNNWRLTLRNSATFSYASESNNDLTHYRYFQPSTAATDPLYNRYTDGVVHNYSVQTFADLNIPLPVFQTLRFTYGHDAGRSHNDNRGYRLDRLGDFYADYDAYLEHFGQLPSGIDWQLVARDADITNNSVTTMNRHWAEAYLQYKRGQFFSSLQNTFRFRRDGIDYERPGYDPLHPRRDVTEYVLNAQLRYANDSSYSYDLNYYYEVAPQEFSYEITIPDNSDPLNVSLGNAGMKNRRYHYLNLRTNRTFKHSRSLSFDMGWNTTINGATSRSTYDRATNITTTQPVNISGLWGVNASANYSMPLDKAQRLTFTASSSYDLRHSAAYTTATQGDPLRRSDTNHSATLRLWFNVRLGKFFGSLFAMSRYNRTLSTLPAADGLDDWFFFYTPSLQYTFPLDIELKTSAKIHHRPGYDIPTYRNVQTIWNVFVTKSFLKSKALALKLECSDILNQREQSWAYINADGSGSGNSMTVGRYVMLHVIYRFSTKKAN